MDTPRGVRPDWRAHAAITGTYWLIVIIASVWIIALNVVFYTVVLREFAPELFQTLTRALIPGG